MERIPCIGAFFCRETFAGAEFLHPNLLVELLKVHNAGFRTVFDPTGIRTWLKSRLLGEDAQSKPLGSVYYESTRDRLQQSAVAADEESSFLYLNGYGSYKAGFRTWLISSDSEFNRILPATGRHPGRA